MFSCVSHTTSPIILTLQQLLSEAMYPKGLLDAEGDRHFRDLVVQLHSLSKNQGNISSQLLNLSNFRAREYPISFTTITRYSTCDLTASIATAEKISDVGLVVVFK
jgi:hypothetical protein